MTVVLTGSADLTLDAVYRVTRGGESIALSDNVTHAIDRRRAAFVAFVETHADQHLYGITTKHHTAAKQVLDAAARAEYARNLPSTPPAGGPGLPEQLRRGMIVARLADILGGTAPLRTTTVKRLLAMLDGPLPEVPELAHGEAGDIIALGHLFRSTFNETLEVGEGMALINGSPVATAVLVDATLDGRERIATAEAVFALAAAAVQAPDAHYDQALGPVWRDPHQARSLAAVRQALVGRTGELLPYQAPVSFRSAPRLLGWLRRCQEQAEESAGLALATPSNNPVFLGEDEYPPAGAILSNGGYHNPAAAPCLDALARSWADLTQLVSAQVNHIIDDPNGLAANEPEPRVSLLFMTSAGWAEQARDTCRPSLIGLATGGQTDTTTPDVRAWRRATDAGQALDANLTILAVVSVHAMARRGQTVPPQIRQLAGDVLTCFPLDSEAVEFAGHLEAVQRKVLGRGA